MATYTAECTVLLTPPGSPIQQPSPSAAIHVLVADDVEEGPPAYDERLILPPGSPIQQPAPSRPDVADIERASVDGECAICLLPIIEPAAFPAKGCTHVYCVKCLVDLQSHTPTQSIVCPQCRRRALPPLPPRRLPPPPISAARKLVILTCMGIGLVLCFAALAYDMGAFGVPFYGNLPRAASTQIWEPAPVGAAPEPARQSGATLSQTQSG